MSLAFIFGVHNHQPLGNFDQVVDEAVRRAYRPFFQTLSRFPRSRAVHTSGLLLEWWEAHAPDPRSAGRAGRPGPDRAPHGGLTEPILALLPDHDKVAQIRALTDRVAKRLGVRPRGMWLAERVWEPHLARPLAEAGVEYVLVDDHHFAMAGLDPDRLSGYYLTEEQGHGVAVFPIAQRLRYQIPFAPVEQVFATLGERAGRGGGALTMVDDGEKFGIWPETHRLVYEEGWLERFFGGLSRVPGVELLTAAEYLDREPPTDRVYLPAASYREMTEWALTPRRPRSWAGPGGAGRRGGPCRGTAPPGRLLAELPGALPRGERRLPEDARVSRRVAAGLAARPSDPVLLAARDLLWRGQCNDAYWHGSSAASTRRTSGGPSRRAAGGGGGAGPGRSGGGPRRAETGDLDGDGAVRDRHPVRAARGAGRGRAPAAP
jgi:hypothetical protein